MAGLDDVAADKIGNGARDFEDAVVGAGAETLLDHGALEEVFGVAQPVQRCRNHKMRNVVDELQREQHARVLNVMRAAWKLSDADEGMKRLEGLARFLEHEYESAARSLREGMAEMFTMSFARRWPNAVRTGW